MSKTNLDTKAIKEPSQSISFKFIIGDEVYFMNYDTPKKGFVEGLVSVLGKAQLGSSSSSVVTDSIRYSVNGAYSLLKENELFSSKEQLIEKVFGHLDKEEK